MFAWLPLIGPFVQAGLNAYTAYKNTQVSTAQIASNERVSMGTQDVQIIQARADVAKAFAHDIGITFARDIIVNWYAVYISLIFYDSCFRNLLPAWMTWRVLALPDNLTYLCGGIVALLFVTSWRGNK